MNKSQTAVSHRIDIPHQGAGATDIIRYDREPVVKYMVYGHHRQVGGDQLQHLRVVEIDAGDDHTVHAAVEAVL